ncbi:unnamed protein product [Coregonus sp. 'balchen']|nr:unnamed protein product [Coregonus sp. 'balchen']
MSAHDNNMRDRKKLLEQFNEMTWQQPEWRTHSFLQQEMVQKMSMCQFAVPLLLPKLLGRERLTKSQILNKLLSNLKQYHDTFVIHDMECGDCPSQNLRWSKEASGPSKNSFSFLCQNISCSLHFIDDFEADLKILDEKITKAELFLVVNSQSKTFKVDTLKKMITQYSIKETNVIVKKKQNDAQFVQNPAVNCG